MIIIERKSSLSNKFTNYNVYLDGNKIGCLSDGETAEFNIEPGNHTLQIKMNISASNKIEFEHEANQFLYFETGSNIKVLNNILLALMHPAILIGIFLIDKIITYKYFIVYALMAYIVFEIYTYIKRKRANNVLKEEDKYYLYLKQTQN